MKKETLERLFNEACELLIIFEEGNIANADDRARISAIFNEVKYSDKIDSEMLELEKNQLAAVNEDGYAIEYIQNPSEELQLAAVSKYGSSIRYIQNPSERVKKLARENGYKL